MITIKDVEFICETINKELTQEEKTEVLNRYGKIDEYDNWTIMVEDIIYEVLNERRVRFYGSDNQDKDEVQEMITNLHNVGEWMMEVVGGNPDDMDEHIKFMLDELDKTIHYLKENTSRLGVTP